MSDLLFLRQIKKGREVSCYQIDRKKYQNLHKMNVVQVICMNEISVKMNQKRNLRQL